MPRTRHVRALHTHEARWRKSPPSMLETWEQVTPSMLETWEESHEEEGALAGLKALKGGVVVAFLELLHAVLAVDVALPAIQLRQRARPGGLLQAPHLAAERQRLVELLLACGGARSPKVRCQMRAVRHWHTQQQGWHPV